MKLKLLWGAAFLGLAEMAFGLECDYCPTGYTQSGSTFSLGNPVSGSDTGTSAADVCASAVRQARATQIANGNSVCGSSSVLFVVNPGVESPGPGNGYMGLECSCYTFGSIYGCGLSINSSTGVCCTPNFMGQESN